MCQRKWSQYNASLVQRGSLTIFCDPKVIRTIRKAKLKAKDLRRTGRPPYPPQLLLVLFLLKIAHGLSYRSCEGMACSLFQPYNIRVPCYSTLCRGVRRLRAMLPKLSKRRPKVYLIDASGFKVKGEGEWKTKVHGIAYRRHWVKVHLLVDSKTNEIVDLLVTSSSTSDIEGGTRLLRSLPSRDAQLLGDGAYDSIKFRREAMQKGIQVVTPPPQNAVLSKDPINCDRNDSIRIIKLLGGDALARSLWGKLTGYRHRVKVESAFSRLKRLFGATLFSRLKESQAIEVHLKALLSNMWLNWNQG